MINKQDLKTLGKLSVVSVCFFMALQPKTELAQSTLDKSTAEAYDTFQKEHKCLTDNIWHEARNQGSKGMRLVAEVTKNRVQSKVFPDSYCKVVYQPWQFSWVKASKQKPLQNSQELQKKSEAATIAYEVMQKEYRNRLPKTVLFFHTKQVTPSWSGVYSRYTTHKDHIFYKKE